MELDWQGWEIHRLAQDVGIELAKAGFAVLWAEEGDVAVETLVPERRLGAAVERAWPAGMRGKVGW